MENGMKDKKRMDAGRMRAAEGGICKVKVKDMVEADFSIFNKPESCGLEAARPRTGGNGTGVGRELET